MQKQQAEQQEWTTIIKPKRKFFSFGLKDLWRYRDLYSIYVVRNITTMYKQTVLGPLWFFIEPVVSIVMYMMVFGGLAGIPTDGIPQPVFYMSGIMLWGYFSTCFNSSANVLAGHAGIFGKVYFPRMIIPLATITSNLVRTGVHLLLFIGIYIYYVCHGAPIAPNRTLFLFPVYLIILALMGLSWGLIVTAMTTKYRDLRLFVSYMLRLFMYATPVIYPSSLAEGKSYARFLKYNPISPFFEAFRYGATGVGTFDWSWMLYGVGVMVVTLVLGMLVFNRVEKNFIDTV